MFIKMTHILAFMILITPLQLTPFWRRGPSKPSKEDRLLALENKLFSWTMANNFYEEFMYLDGFGLDTFKPDSDFFHKLDPVIAKAKQDISAIYQQLSSMGWL